MGEKITFYKNDTQRAIETQMDDIRKWSKDNPDCNLDATDMVLQKLQEAWFWALDMVKDN